MDGPSHYQAAETWLLRAERAAGTGTAGSSASIGIGHAVLALAAATALGHWDAELWTAAAARHPQAGDSS